MPYGDSVVANRLIVFNKNKTSLGSTFFVKFWVYYLPKIKACSTVLYGTVPHQKTIGSQSISSFVQAVQTVYGSDGSSVLYSDFKDYIIDLRIERKGVLNPKSVRDTIYRERLIERDGGTGKRGR